MQKGFNARRFECKGLNAGGCCKGFDGEVDVGSIMQRIDAGGLLQPQGFDAGELMQGDCCRGIVVGGLMQEV